MQLEDRSTNSRGLISETSGTHQFFSPECCSGGVRVANGTGAVKFGAVSTTATANADEDEADVTFSGYAVDMWACGVSLFACVFGMLPFYASEPLELFELIGKYSF